MKLPREKNRATIILAILPILWFSMCKGRNYSSADIMIDPIPKADVHPDTCTNIPQLNITQSQATDFMEKEMASISFVPLETGEDCLIGSISDLYLKGDTIVVVDGEKAKCIMLFNRQGKFLRQIGNVGSGPGEYTTITQSRISAEGIEINDWRTHHFIKYDFEGNVLKAITFHQTNPHNLYHIGGEQFFAAYASYDANRPFALRWLENDSVVASAFPFSLKRNEVAPSIFLLDRNKVGFHIPFSDTIYSISDRRIIPEYTLGLMNEAEIQDYFKKAISMTQEEVRKFLWSDKRAPAYYVGVLSTDNHMIISHQKQGSSYITVIDRNTLNSRSYLSTTIKPLKAYLPSRIVSATGNTLIGCLDETYPMYTPDESREFIEEHFSPEDRQLLQTYDYGNNNPIVWLMELK